MALLQLVCVRNTSDALAYRLQGARPQVQRFEEPLVACQPLIVLSIPPEVCACEGARHASGRRTSHTSEDTAGKQLHELSVQKNGAKQVTHSCMRQTT